MATLYLQLILVSWACWNKYYTLHGLKHYNFIVAGLEGRSLKSRCWEGYVFSETCRRILSYLFWWFLGNLWCSMTCCIHLISLFLVTWWSPCVCVFTWLSFYLFIYFWLCWVFVDTRRASLIVVNRGYSLLWCIGFSLQWLLLLQSMDSRVYRL